MRIYFSLLTTESGLRTSTWVVQAQKIDHPGAWPEKGRLSIGSTDPAIVDPSSRAVPAGSRASANAFTSVSNLFPPEVPPRVP